MFNLRILRCFLIFSFVFGNTYLLNAKEENKKYFLTNFFGASFFANSSIAFAGVPITSDIPEGSEIDITYIDVVPHFSAGFTKNITNKLFFVTEYTFVKDIKNPTTITQTLVLPSVNVDVKSVYSLTSGFQGVYAGFEYYYTKRAYIGLKVGVNYLKLGGDLNSKAGVTVQLPFNKTLKETYNIYSTSSGSKYSYGIKINGGYDLFTIKKINFSLYSEYIFIYNKTDISVSVPNIAIKDLLIDAGYPSLFTTGHINHGSIGFRVRY